MIQIYHNPRCGKSRKCLVFLEDSKKEFEVVNYLKNSPTFEELSLIIQKLNIKPLDLVRQNEKIWTENYKNKILTDSEITQALVSNPILIQRPIVIKNDKAIIGREIEKVAQFI